MKTISLELAKRLKEAGFERESRVSYYVTSNTGTALLASGIKYVPEIPIYPAYTFEEIWAMLPKKIIVDDYAYWLYLTKTQENKCRIGYMDINETADCFTEVFGHDNPTEAAGLLLEWAIKEGHVKP